MSVVSSDPGAPARNPDQYTFYQISQKAMSIQVLVARAGRRSEKRLARNRMNFQPLRNVEERGRRYAPLLDRRSLESSMYAESSVPGAPAHNQDQYTFYQISQKAMSIQILGALAGRPSEKRLGAQWNEFPVAAQC